MEERAAGIVPPFYVRNGQRWADRRAALVVSEAPLGATTCEEGMILPLRRRTDVVVADALFEGGACDRDGRFIGGHLRSGNPNGNLCCARAYVVDEAGLARSDERVVFGGVLYDHFGHQLLDSPSRLWYVAQHGLEGRKLAFVKAVTYESLGFSDAYRTFLAALGVDERDVMLVERPTRFAEVVVPDEALQPFGNAHVACARPYRMVRDAAKAGSVEKLYLTRRNFHRGDYVNEDFIEEFYVRRGFCAVSPETLPFAEQVALIAGAREVVTTVGTMSHLATLFCRDDARLTYFVRTREVLPQQLILDKMCGKQPFYVDATRNLLPTTQASAAFLFGPTRCFRAYLDDAGIPYDDSELAEDTLTEADMVRFLRVYDAAAVKRENQVRLGGYDLSDVLAALHEGLRDEPARKEDYALASATARERAHTDEARARMRRAGDWGPTAAHAASCSFTGRLLTLGLSSSRLFSEGAACSLVLENAAGTRRHTLAAPEDVRLIEPGKVQVKVDVGDFFQERLSEPACCERWDVCVEVDGALSHIGLDEGWRPFIAFTKNFLCEDGRLLVPHLGAEGGMCFWLVGERRNDFSDDFFAPRVNRPLASDLLYRLLRAGRHDDALALGEQVRRGRIRCLPLTDDAVFYRGYPYHVAAYAYLEACTLHKPVTPARAAARWKWEKRLEALPSRAQ